MVQHQQLIGMAKEAKLKNSAPIKYQIEVSAKHWENIFKRERITDPKKMQDCVVEEKRKIIDFLTGAENSGKALFSTFYVLRFAHRRSTARGCHQQNRFR